MTDSDFAFVLDVKGNVVKRDKNLTEEAEKIVTISSSYIKNERLDEAFQLILNFEKEARNAADYLSYCRVILHMLDIMYECQLWDTLADIVVKLSKRRGQFKQAIVDIVQRCYTYVEKILDRTVRLTIIKTLCQVSENRIYVENERARLLMMLSKDAEEHENIDEAFDYIRDLQTESYSEMPIEEKNEFMLEQCRLCLLKNDLVRSQVISNRIFPNTINSETTPTLKFKYYKTMMKIKFLQQAYIEVAQIGLSCIDLNMVATDPVVFYPIFKTIIMCLLVCPLDQTRKDLTVRVASHRNFMEMDFLKTILEMFMVDELIDWADMQEKYINNVSNMFSPTDFAFVTGPEESNSYLLMFRARVNEHNLVVIQNCYSQISLLRLSELLHLTIDSTETVLCRAIVDHVVFARINRPRQIVVFKPVLASPQILDAYILRIQDLFKSIGRVSTLINTESEFRKSGNIKC